MENSENHMKIKCETQIYAALRGLADCSSSKTPCLLGYCINFNTRLPWLRNHGILQQQVIKTEDFFRGKVRKYGILWGQRFHFHEILHGQDQHFLEVFRNKMQFYLIFRGKKKRQVLNREWGLGGGSDIINNYYSSSPMGSESIAQLAGKK